MKIEPGTKAPKGDGWNRPGGWFADADAARAWYERHPDWNMGAVLGPSRLCSLDVDHVGYCEQVLASFGIDIHMLARQHPTVVGNPARFRVEFRVPEGAELTRKALSWPSERDPDGTKLRALVLKASAAKRDGETALEAQLRAEAHQFKRTTVFELRAGDVQDVFPPSVHPDTGKPYIWRTPPTEGFKQLPDELWQIWVDWDDFKRKAEAMCPWAPKARAKPSAAARPAQAPAAGESVIDAFNHAKSIEQLLDQCGYKQASRKKWISPYSQSGTPGVQLMRDGTHVVIFHSSDPLGSDAGDRPVSAFDLYVEYHHGGDVRAAVKAAAAELGMQRPRRERAARREESTAEQVSEPSPPAPSSSEPPEPPFPPTEAAAGGNDDDGGDPDWERQITRNGRGDVKPTVGNVSLILANDRHWQGVLAKNTFSEAIEKLRPPPFEHGRTGEWTDMDDNRARLWIERVYGFSPKKEDIADAIIEIADRHAYHPVRQYLNTLEWDGTARVETFAADYLGVKLNDYSRAVCRKWLIQAIARVMSPGCKADNVLILEGKQGLRKSTALKTLAGAWFSDAPMKIGDKEAYLLIQGVWIVELAELDSFNKADSSAAKLFFSQSENHYRPWYARRPIKVPRQCVFAGSVNNDNYLKDDTGNRRYWPLRCTAIDIPALAEVRDQIWAEALQLWREGVPWWVDTEDAKLFEEEQAQRYVADAYTDLIRTWTEGVVMERRIKDGEGFQMAEVLADALKLDTGRWTRAEQIRVGHCLRELGFVRRRSSAAGRPWVYVLGNLDLAEVQEGEDDLPI